MSSPKRSFAVEQILEKNNPEYEEIFKTRTKVVDDRPKTPNFPISKMDISKGDLSFDLADVLNSSSQAFILPEIEARYLEQYQLDTKRLFSIEKKLDKMNEKLKQVRGFIKEKIRQEELEYLREIVKIQSWFRGIRCRQKLIRDGVQILKIKESPSRHSAATKIQAIWRGYYTRNIDLNSIVKLQKLRINLVEKEIKLLRKEGKTRDNANLALINSIKEENRNYQAEIMALTDLIKGIKLDMIAIKVVFQLNENSVPNCAIYQEGGDATDLNEKFFELNSNSDICKGNSNSI